MSNQDAINAKIAQYLAQGETLSNIQNLLKEEGCSITFMELRILAAELESVDWTRQDPPAPAPEETPAEDAPAETPAADAPARTTVEVNRVVRPGALAEGTVQFASGASATWVVDQFQRLGLEKVTGEPTEQDIREFQEELQRAFGR
ncbi:MAG: hypothetical protein J6R85_01580 [Lentisphaeria bacterium]|nr:hypothetical protein [Lentisphaeria bacterium]